jgi:hypothetical protein
MTYSEIEEVRQFWNNRPCNIRHGTAKLGSRGYIYNEMQPVIEAMLFNYSEDKDKIIENLGSSEIVNRHFANRHKHLAPKVLNLKIN